MTAPRFITQPQRRILGAWTPCEQHQAQRFAVVSLIPATGRFPAKAKTLLAFPTLSQANDHRSSLERRHRKRREAPTSTPGTRYGNQPRGAGTIYAASTPRQP